MSAIKVNIKGLNETLDYFKNGKAKYSKAISQELRQFGEDVRGDAIRNLRNNSTDDEGNLRNSISSYLDGPYKVLIVVSADYAAFIEFGTRQFAAQYVASLPDEWQQFASTFKGSGSGGSFEDLVIKIAEWVKRKGITITEQSYDFESGHTIHSVPRKRSKDQKASEIDQAAYLIARKIVTKGIPAQPFLVPAVEANKIKLIENLKNIFK